MGFPPVPFLYRDKKERYNRTDLLFQRKGITKMNETEMKQKVTEQKNPLGTEPVGQLLRKFAVPSIATIQKYDTIPVV